MYVLIAALCLGTLLSAIGAGYGLLRLPNKSRGRVGLWVLLSALLTAPWALPAQERFGRMVVALVVCLSFVRVWETARGTLPSIAQKTLLSYAYYFVNLPDTHYSATPEARSLARRRGRQRVARGLGKALLLLGLFGVSSTWPQLWNVHLASVAWCLISAYLCCSAIVDVSSGANMWLSGHDAVEVFVAPFLARSPRDFWGRRWNMTFRNASHRLIFAPLYRHSPFLAVCLVFIWSAAVHEYLVVASLQTTHGQMTAFFLLNGAASMLESYVRRPVPLSRPVAISLHWAWMLLTSPLFFAPMRQIVPVETYRLW